MSISKENTNLTLENMDIRLEFNSLKKAFALACRHISDNFECPAAILDIKLPECNGELDKCGDDGAWICWQRYFFDIVDKEPVCRVCGCTWNNACSGGCSWVEEDLCSACIEEDESENGAQFDDKMTSDSYET